MEQTTPNEKNPRRLHNGSVTCGAFPFKEDQVFMAVHCLYEWQGQTPVSIERIAALLIDSNTALPLARFVDLHKDFSWTQNPKTLFALRWQGKTWDDNSIARSLRALTQAQCVSAERVDGVYYFIPIDPTKHGFFTIRDRTYRILLPKLKEASFFEDYLNTLFTV